VSGQLPKVSDDESDEDYDPTEHAGEKDTERDAEDKKLSGKGRRRRRKSSSSGQKDSDSDENESDDDSENESDEDSEDDSGDDSDEDSDASDTSGSDVVVDEDEMAGLLQDAETDTPGSALALMAAAASSPTSGPSSTVKKRSLSAKDKRKKAAGLGLSGKGDVGRSLARVVRGVVVFGKIVDYHLKGEELAPAAESTTSAITSENLQETISTEEPVSALQQLAVKAAMVASLPETVQSDAKEEIPATTVPDTDKMEVAVESADVIIVNDSEASKNDNETLKTGDDGNVGESKEVDGSEEAVGRKLLLQDGVWVVEFDDESRMEYNFDEIRLALSRNHSRFSFN